MTPSYPATAPAVKPATSSARPVHADNPPAVKPSVWSGALMVTALRGKRRALKLSPAAVEVLQALASHRNKAHTVVHPSRSRLMALSGYSETSVKRALRELHAAKLAVRVPWTGSNGKPCQGYDLANAWALLQELDAAGTGGPEMNPPGAQRAPAVQAPAEGQAAPDGQSQGGPTLDPEAEPRVCKEATAQDLTPDHKPLVAALVRAGVHYVQAVRLAAQLPREAVEHWIRESTRAKPRSRGAWLNAALTAEIEGTPWARREKGRPQRHGAPPSTARPPARDTPDPLPSLAPEERAALEERARADIKERTPLYRRPMAPLIPGEMVLARMRKLLAQERQKDGGGV